MKRITKSSPQPYPIQREGFWKPPRAKKSGLPAPVPNKESWVGKKKFLKALVKYQKKLDKTVRREHSKGWSNCRLCRKKNGSTTFRDTKHGWVWPDGYYHYVKVHNVRPSLAFQEFIECRIIKG